MRIGRMQRRRVAAGLRSRGGPREGWPSGSGRNTLIRALSGTDKGRPRRYSGEAGRKRVEPPWSEIGARLNFRIVYSPGRVVCSISFSRGLRRFESDSNGTVTGALEHGQPPVDLEEAAHRISRKDGARPEIAVRVGRDSSTRVVPDFKGRRSPSRPNFSTFVSSSFLHHYIQ